MDYSPFILAVITFFVASIFAKNIFVAAIVFPALVIFAVLRAPLKTYPVCILKSSFH